MKNPSSERGRAWRGEELTLSKIIHISGPGRQGGLCLLSSGDQSLFWQRRCLNLFIKSLDFAPFDGAAASFFQGFTEGIPCGLQHPARSCQPRGQFRPFGDWESPADSSGWAGLPHSGLPSPLPAFLGFFSLFPHPF